MYQKRHLASFSGPKVEFSLLSAALFLLVFPMLDFRFTCQLTLLERFSTITLKSVRVGGPYLSNQTGRSRPPRSPPRLPPRSPPRRSRPPRSPPPVPHFSRSRPCGVPRAISTETLSPSKSRPFIS